MTRDQTPHTFMNIWTVAQTSTHMSHTNNNQSTTVIINNWSKTKSVYIGISTVSPSCSRVKAVIVVTEITNFWVVIVSVFSLVCFNLKPGERLHTIYFLPLTQLQGPCMSPYLPHQHTTITTCWNKYRPLLSTIRVMNPRHLTHSFSVSARHGSGGTDQTIIIFLEVPN